MISSVTGCEITLETEPGSEEADRFEFESAECRKFGDAGTKLLHSCKQGSVKQNFA